ncbi:hypothetical protein ACFYUY_12680 [Kitasatospora sp. NPDC004745]|uniref:hypothetical protein n=1 Tax=Kitasatospora sp. NPDC004745 TaxID=3364019 RepID=UPI0036B45B93
MPARPRRSTFTAVSSAALALCTAVVVAGCAAAQADTREAAVSGVGAPVATTNAAADGRTAADPTGAPEPTTTQTPPATTPSSAPTPAPNGAAATAPSAARPSAPAPKTAAPTPPAAAAPVPQGPAGTAAPLTAAVAPAGLAELPIAPAFGWKPDGPLASQDVKGRTITLNECTSVSGAVTWQQQGYLSAARNPAGQQLFAFPTPGAAQAAYRQLLADMGSCQDASRRLQAERGVAQDATVTRTAQTPDGTSWSRRWTGAGGLSAPDLQTNHVYALQQGADLTLFQFDELQERPGPAHDTGTDASVIAAVAALGPKG